MKWKWSSSLGVMECAFLGRRRQVNVGLITYRGPGEDDPSLKGRFQLQEGPDKVASRLLGKRGREDKDELEDEEEDEL
jgi:hypothetical protein